MKIWSPLFATLLLLHGLKAQFDDEVTIEAVDDDTDFGIEIEYDSEPCNGYPQYRDLPVNQAVYLASQQTKNSISPMLNDGIRYFNIDICTSEKKNLVVCSSDKTFEDVLNEAFIFARETPEQFFIVNLGSEDIKQVEKVMDKVCKVHTELTAGTDEYVELKCPFIYKHEKGPWPSIGELVNYNPEQAQWEGDGELVGVRTKMLFTTSSKDGYISPYFTPTFWREFQGSGLSELKQELKKGCRVPAGGIKLNAYSSEDYTPAEIEELILDRSGCNLNDSPLNTFISIVSQNKYEKNLDYLKELKDRLMEVNFAKWNGDYELVKPSSLVKRVQRDEL